jgi:hypothetical protein
MQIIDQQEDLDLFEVILQFEGNSWRFSTFAQGCRMQEALERAEREFSVHSLHHKLHNVRAKITSAQVIRACDGRSFAKHDGKWRLAHSLTG